MIKALISDSDGTLVNTLYLIRHGQYEAAAEYLATRGMPREHIPPYEQYVKVLNKVVGGPTKDTLHKSLMYLAENRSDIDLEQIDFDELDQSLTPIQDRLAPLYVHPFPGLDDLLKMLSTLEIKLGIFTSGDGYMIVRHFGVSVPALGYSELYKDKNSSNKEKLQAFTERMKAIYDLPDFTVVTHEDVSSYKPDPEGILLALDRLGVKPEEAVVLGDHPFDMEAARRAGVRSLGITQGFGSAEELRAAGASAICANLYEVIYQLQYVL
jgi:phosphoglycolate phosphatase-like HAD superfamily hydrolase